MALRSTLNEVVELVRGETGVSTNTSRGVDHREHIVRLIKSRYEELAEEYEWEHLRIVKTASVSRKTLSAGQNVYDFPAALNPQRITRAWVKWGGSWSPLSYGITQEHFSALDPDEDQRSDPVSNWQFYNGDQFEVWPIPATTGAAEGYQVGFDGQKIPEALSSNNARMDMDDLLVGLYVSAEILAESDPKRAQAKLDRANRRLLTTRGNMGSKTRVAFGRGVIDDEPRRPRAPTYIR